MLSYWRRMQWWLFKCIFFIYIRWKYIFQNYDYMIWLQSQCTDMKLQFFQIQFWYKYNNNRYMYGTIRCWYCASLYLLNICDFQGPRVFQYRGNKGHVKIQFLVTKMLKSLYISKLTMFFNTLSFRHSLVRIKFTPIIATVTWTRDAIAKVFQNKWQMYPSNAEIFSQCKIKQVWYFIYIWSTESCNIWNMIKRKQSYNTCCRCLAQ